MKKLAAVLAVVIVAPLVVAAAGCGGAEDEEAAAPAAQRSGALGKGVLGAPTGIGVVDEAVGAPPAPAEPAPTPLPAESFAQEDVLRGSASTLPAIGPRIVKTAYLRLSVAKGRFQEVVTRAESIAVGHGGFVASSTASKGLGERLVRGTLVVRVPEGAFTRVIRQLERLGTVQAREESGQDVSAQFVDLEARARHLEAVEAQLLEFLDRADEVGEALVIQQQLNGVQLELEQVRGQLRYLNDQASFATISIELNERGVAAAAKEKDDHGWGVLDAWRDGARGFVNVAAAVFVGVATAAPVLLLVAAGLVAARFALLSRRRARGEGGRPAEHAG